MKKILWIAVMGLLLGGCAENKGSMKGAFEKMDAQLKVLKDKKQKVENNCLKAAKEKFEDPEKILADYKICMMEKGYKNE